MRAVRVVGVLVIVAGATVAGFWAGRVALEPPEDPLAVEPEPTTYVVDVGSVGRSLTFTVVAEWDLVPVGQNSAGGVVTSVEVAPGDTVQAGDVLYTLGLKPVVIAQGEVPMFRSLATRSEGPDVAQLQRLLAGLGFYSADVDGSFGSSTQAAVRAWQDSLGVDDTGVVDTGDLVFVPELPVRIAPSEEVTVGARLVGGEPVVLVVPADPAFWIPLAVEQAALVPLSADVSVIYPDGVWQARIQQALETPEFGTLDLHLSGLGGGSVCGSDCAVWVDLQARSDFRAEIVVIPDTSGPVVPVAAITSDAANNAFVTLEDGSLVPVTVVESASGLAVVDGIDLGTEILLFGEQ